LAIVKKLFRETVACSDPVQRGRLHHRSMADFLAVVGIVAFVAVMLGLVWALDRV